MSKTWFYQTPVGTTPAPGIDLQWNASDELSGFNRGACQVNEFVSGTGWSPYTAIGAASGTNPYTYSMPSYEPPDGILAIASTNLATLLPLKFTAIDAERIRDAAEVSWSIADAYNVDYFEVERSVDGSSFESIGKAGYEAFKEQYVYKDPMPYDGVQFYRIKAVDLDGSYRYSDIAFLPAASVSSLRVWKSAPHRIRVQSYSPDQAQAVEIYNMLGQLIVRKVLNPGDTEISLPELSRGMYLVRIGRESFLLP